MSDAYVYTPYVLKHDGSVVHHGQVQAAIDSLGRWTAQAVNLIAAGGTAPIGTAGGDLGGTYPSPTVVKAAGDFAVAADVNVTGNVNVKGALSSTTNIQPAGPTNSGFSAGGGPNYALIGLYDQGLTANNRTCELIFISGAMTLRFKNDAGSSATPALSISGGFASGITGIASSSGSGSWAHTGDFSVSGKARVPLVAYTAISGTGGTTLNAAALAGSNAVYVARTGATALFTDTTDNATNLINAFPGGAPVGFAWSVIYQNNSSFNATLAGGSGVTISGQAVTSASSVTEYVAKVTGAGAITLYSIRSSGVA